ncbi:MAG: TniQ family protein [Candidatus Saccharibacteria bacterium]|nr:TniQ family protein [Moraxellaceae bacterium]
MNTINDFFGNSALLSWLPDETLFSLASRHHYYWGRRLSRHTNLLLFGRPNGGSQHDLPSCIDEFSKRTKEHFGTAVTICKERTLLCYYSRFMQETEIENAIATMRSTTVAHLKLRLGILTSRFRANHPLKAFPACMKSDRESYGWAYWHLQHQYPGVWICPIHVVPLLESDLKASGVERFFWHLPDESHLRSWTKEASALCDSAMEHLARLANLTIQTVHQEPSAQIDLTRLHPIYRLALGERNLLTKNGGLQLTNIANEFKNHVESIRALPEFMAFPATDQEARSQLTRQLRMARAGTHPLRHIVMIDWLVGNFGSFSARYNENAVASELSKRPMLSASVLPFESTEPPPSQDVRKLELAKLIQEGGKSIRAAAIEMHIDTATALVWAAQLGIEVSRRPKKLKEQLRRDLVEQLKLGVGKDIAAKNFQISIVTVTHVLRTEIGLHAQWQYARFQAAQHAAREAWATLIKGNEELGVKFIRHLDPRSYAWLYRNDRAWLAEHSPARRVVADQHNTSVRWDLRDIELCAAVERAALALLPTMGRHKLMMWHLYQAIPELKAKQSALKQLPLTLRAIKVALHHPVSANNQIDLAN